MDCWAIHEAIRRERLQLHSVAEILAALHLPRSTYFWHLQHIRAEDAHWLHELAKAQFVTTWRQAVAFLEARQRDCLTLAQTAAHARDRIEAQRLAADLEITKLDVLAKGPMVMQVQALTAKTVPAVTA